MSMGSLALAIGRTSSRKPPQYSRRPVVAFRHAGLSFLPRSRWHAVVVQRAIDGGEAAALRRCHGRRAARVIARGERTIERIGTRVPRGTGSPPWIRG